MEHKKEIFADGIGQIHFAGGMVRFDFVTLQPNEDGSAPFDQMEGWALQGSFKIRQIARGGC